MRELQSHPSRIRKLIGGLAVTGGVALAGFTVLQRPVVGVGVYLVALAGTIFFLIRAERPLFDERDEAIAQEAAAQTLTVFGLASAGVFPALTVAWGLGAFEWQPWSSAIGLFVALLYLTYGAVTVALQRRR